MRRLSRKKLCWELFEIFLELHIERIYFSVNSHKSESFNNCYLQCVTFRRHFYYEIQNRVCETCLLRSVPSGEKANSFTFLPNIFPSHYDFHVMKTWFH